MAGFADRPRLRPILRAPMTYHTPCEIRSVFVGSTVKDLHSHRTNVHDALTNIPVAAFLSEEHWVVPFCDIEAECQNRLAAADGYLGIFAHWHGWVPDGQDRSITALEFKWAFRRWGQQALSHMAVFMPEDGCEEDRNLRRAADELLAKFPDIDSRDLHCYRHKEFLKEVTTLGRVINQFRSITHLREGAISVVGRWQKEIWKAIATAANPSESVWTNVELGRLGRWDQNEQFKKLVAKSELLIDVPALGVVLSGPRNHGHGACLEYLSSEQRGKFGRHRAVSPPGDSYDVPALVRQIASCLELPGDFGAVAELAVAIAPLLEKNRLFLILEQIFKLNGGLQVFQEQFWAPLVKDLAAQASRSGKSKKLVMMVTDVSDTKPKIGVSSQAALRQRQLDPNGLITLPRLKPITDSDIGRWLDEVGCPDDDDVRDNAVKVALTGDDGQPDGTPALVYQRLAKLDLPTDEDS